MSKSPNFYPTFSAYSWIPTVQTSKKHSDYNDLSSSYFIKQKKLGFLKKSYFFYKLKRFNSFLFLQQSTKKKMRGLLHWNYHYNFLNFRKLNNNLSTRFFLSRSVIMRDKYKRGEWTNFNVMWKKHYHKTTNLFFLNSVFKKITTTDKPNLFILFYPLKNELWGEVSKKGFPLLGLNVLGSSAILDYPLFLNYFNSEAQSLFFQYFTNSFYNTNFFFTGSKSFSRFKFQNLMRFYTFRHNDKLLLNKKKIHRSTFFSKFYLKRYPFVLSTKRNLLSVVHLSTLNVNLLNGFTKLPVSYLKYFFRSLKRKEKKQRDKNFFIRQNFLNNIKKIERSFIRIRKKLLQKTWLFPYYLKQKLKKSIFLNSIKRNFLLSHLFTRFISILMFKKNSNSFLKLPVEIPKYSIIWRFNKIWLQEEEKKVRREAYLFQQWCGIYPTWWEFPLQRHKRLFNGLTANYYSW